jgi:4'-phosphopantetheinyl transferase
VSVVLTRVVPLVEPTAADRSLLDAGETARADRRSDPRPFVIAHAALRRLLADHLTDSPTAIVIERRCPTCGSDRHGKPTLPDHPGVHVSLSYGEGLVLVALTEAGELGVDVESARSADFGGFDRVTLADVERPALDGLVGEELLLARARLWARKEAVLKATGHGLVVDPRQVVVSGPTAPPALVAWTATQRRPAALALADLDLDLDVGLDVDLGRPGADPTSRAHVGAIAVLADSPIIARSG